MRLTSLATIALVAFTLQGKVGQAQAKPSQPEKFITPFNITLFSADATLRMLDGYTTVNLLNNPCKCAHETNPLAPHSGSIGKQVAFQAGALAATTGTAWLLHHYHHEKLSKIILMIDIGNESRSIIGNYMVDTSANHVTGTQLTNKSLNK